MHVAVRGWMAPSSPRSKKMSRNPDMHFKAITADALTTTAEIIAPHFWLLKQNWWLNLMHAHADLPSSQDLSMALMGRKSQHFLERSWHTARTSAVLNCHFSWLQLQQATVTTNMFVQCIAAPTLAPPEHFIGIHIWPPMALNTTSSWQLYWHLLNVGRMPKGSYSRTTCKSPFLKTPYVNALWEPHFPLETHSEAPSENTSENPSWKRVQEPSENPS